MLDGIDMFDIDGTLVSLDLVERFFCCDLDTCLGSCCIEGDSGAPLTEEEYQQLKAILPEVWDDLLPQAQEQIKEHGVAYVDVEGELVTQLVGMLSFLLAILGLWLFDVLRGEPAEESGRYRAGKTALGVLAVVAMAALAFLLRADYTVFAVIAVFLFYVLRRKHPLVRNAVGVGFLALTRTLGYYAATGLSFIPLALYNGKKGRGLKWLFYVVYPGHLLLLYLIRQLAVS